ncbi:hypothetical protein CLV58_109235 [Spirosoma oryzae]|uniref:Uncharacterized protein n=1 Tax=Spirosoma oryzae TaxID=1469603 RepID=A0A2T0SYM0_9BACT|nr:hypothetical protein [Spirosoma oryzae]PRY38508.1 hypothetical protein CLV58_109235 [Spirosoma oryzae]
MNPDLKFHNKTIDQRAEKIEAILQEFYDFEPEDLTQAPGDLLADVFHYLAHHNQSIMETLDRAKMHFTGERFDQDLPDYQDSVNQMGWVMLS